MRVNPGEVWLADLGMAAKTRPVIVVSRYDSNPPRDIIIYVPCTTQDRGSSYEVNISELSFLREDGVANVQGLGSVPSRRLERKLGVVPDALMQKIRNAIKFALNLA
ncbi:MAG: type II toxin-antitoxin system PemK/MazF family toxin [Methylacidiphilales bacterium]|nr:type II toxin-antitoxin system PemK/MazF family toxin [Candidatus Methylacidiphilales bacterium]